MSSLELQARSVQSILCSPPSTPQVTIPDNDSPFNPFANVVSTPQPVTKPKGYGSHSQPFTQKKKTPPKAVKTPDVANVEPSTPPRKLSVSEFRRFPVVRGIASSSREWRLMQADAEALHWHGVRLVKLVGSGPVSTVYEAEDFTRKDDTGKPLKVAARVMDWSTVPGIYQRSVYPKLMKIYEMFPSHPNIVGLIQRIVDGPTNYLLQEWCSLGSLHVALGPSGCLARGASELTAREILKQVCQGLQFLLDHDVPHGRLTSENVLLDRNMCVKLSDYGYPASSCSNCTDDDLHLRFRAPEMLMGKTFTAYAGDVWSLGVVLYFTLHSALPFTATDVANSARCINLPPLQCRTSLSYPCVMFLKRLLTFNARSRPSLKDAIIDPWMTQAPKKRPIQHVPCFRDHKEEGEVGFPHYQRPPFTTTPAASPPPPPPTLGSSATSLASYKHRHQYQQQQEQQEQDLYDHQDQLQQQQQQQLDEEEEHIQQQRDQHQQQQQYDEVQEPMQQQQDQQQQQQQKEQQEQAPYHHQDQQQQQQQHYYTTPTPTTMPDSAQSPLNVTGLGGYRGHGEHVGRSSELAKAAASSCLYRIFSSYSMSWRDAFLSPLHDGQQKTKPVAAPTSTADQPDIYTRLNTVFGRCFPMHAAALTLLAMSKPKAQIVQAQQEPPSPSVRCRDQLRVFLYSSQRLRMRFYRHYGGNIPPDCTEFPLPPVTVIKVPVRRTKI